MTRLPILLPPVRLSATLVSIALAAALGCSDDPAAPAPDDANVTVEGANRVAETIGPAGGTVTTTSDAGIVYTLAIPAGALPGDVEVAITPVTSIGALPYSGGIEGAVRLGPSGLNLLVPAVLTIGRTATPTGFQRLVGFLYEGDAAAFEVSPGGQTGGEMRVMVSHFSGAGAALADPADIGDCEALGPDEPLSVVLTTCVESGDRAAFLDLMQRVFDDLVEPAVQNGAGDALQDGIRDYLAWRMIAESGLAEVYNAGDAEIVFADRILAIETTISTKIEEGIAAAKSQCAPGDVQWLIEVFEFRALAVAVFEGLPPGLDDLIFADLCASAIVESTDLADPLPLNQDRSLDIDLALDVDGTPTDAAFAVSVTDPDNFVRTPAGRTDAQGRYTTVVRRLIEEGANFDVRGTLILPLFGASGLALAEVPITVEDQVFRGGNARVTTDLPATVSPATFTLNLLVERLIQSGYAPVDGAQLTLSVQGGSASPSQLTTDPAGVAETAITPSATAQPLVIDIAVTLDGVNLGSKRVEAAIVAGGIVLRSNTHSLVSSFDPRDNGICTGSGNSLEYVEHTGHVSLAAQTEEHCVNPLQQTTTRSGFASLIANPGLEAGGQSAAMTFQSSGTAYASVDTCIDAFFCTNISSNASVIFHVEFDVVGASMNFAFDLTHGWDALSPSSARVTLTRQSGANPQIINWSGTPTDLLLVGNLTPGYYVFEFGVNVAVTALPNGPARTATWNTEGTLTITPSPPALGAVR